MNALLVLSGFAVALLALAVFGYALGYLVRSLAMFLPPAGQFVGDMTALREQQATSAQMPSMAGVVPMPSWPTRREPGLAPPPVDVTSETNFTGPPPQPGDRDFFDAETLEMIAQANRHQRQAERPAGTAVEGDRLSGER